MQKDSADMEALTMFDNTLDNNDKSAEEQAVNEESTVSAAIRTQKEKDAAKADIPEKYRDLPVDEDGIRQFITKDMLIGDVIELYPEAARALLSVGMHCITCGVAIYESVEEASYVHGLEPDDVVKVVNDMLTTQLIEHPGEEVHV